MTNIFEAALPPAGHEWVAKVRRPGGGESVLRGRGTELEAQTAADAYNEPYQSDDAYIEPWDAAKAADWPSSTPASIAEFAERAGIAIVRRP